MNNLKKIKAESEIRQTVVAVLESKTATVAIRTAAVVCARFDAYKTVRANFEKFILQQVEALVSGIHKGEPQVVLSLANLVLEWVMYTEQFLIESEDVIRKFGVTIHKSFVEDMIKEFPSDVKKRLRVEWRKKQKEAAVWFSTRLQEVRNGRG